MVRYLAASSFSTLKTRLGVALPNGLPVTDENVAEVQEIYLEIMGRRMFRSNHDSMIKLGLLSPILVYLKKSRPKKNEFPDSYIADCYGFFGVDYE